MAAGWAGMTLLAIHVNPRRRFLRQQAINVEGKRSARRLVRPRFRIPRSAACSL
jgi:hypothetical protein